MSEKLISAYKYFWTTEQGKIVLADLMSYCGLYRPVEGLSAERYEERRNVMLYILAKVHGDRVEKNHDEIASEFNRIVKQFRGELPE